MKAPLFTGSCVALVTPFTDGGIDYDAFGNLIDWQIESGTDAILVCGTTGEAATLSFSERQDAIAFCVERTAGRVPVLAGSGSNNTETAVTLSKEAEKLGVDGLLIVTP